MNPALPHTRQPQPLRRRIGAAVAAAAILGSGMTAVAATSGTGVASAAECKSSTAVKKTFIVDYYLQKSVPDSVGAGGDVTYSLSLSTSSVGNPYVQGVWDIPPTVLKDVKPTVKVKTYTLLGGLLGGGGVVGSVVDTKPIKAADVIKDGRSWKIAHTGWAVFSGKAFVAEFTYKLPSSVKVGTQLTSGGATFQATPSPPLGYVEMGELTACTKIRTQNAGEFIGGSMDSNGLGSSEGGLSSAGGLGEIIGGLIG